MSLLDITRTRAIEEAKKLGTVIGDTQEDDMVIAWYNDETGSTKCVCKVIPYYYAFENIQQAKAVRG